MCLLFPFNYFDFIISYKNYGNGFKFQPATTYPKILANMVIIIINVERKKAYNIISKISLIQRKFFFYTFGKLAC